MVRPSERFFQTALIKSLEQETTCMPWGCVLCIRVIRLAYGVLGSTQPTLTKFIFNLINKS